MNRKVFAIAVCRTAFLIVLTWIAVAATTTFAQERDVPWTCEEILGLKQSDWPDSAVIAELETHKTNCDLEGNSELLVALVKAGGGPELINAIRANQETALTIFSPEPHSEVGATVKVEGFSRVSEGRYLWVFTHREGLEVWWPQGGRVVPDDSGLWRQVVQLGQPRDIGFDFEIAAIWVNDLLNQELRDYLVRGENEGRWPGIRLPEGSPCAVITVHKVSHD